MQIETKNKKKFTTHLMKWFATHQRPLPWKGIKNPYHIWLSEIILQQTRVEQGMPYYHRFVESYPTVKDLAKAPEDEVMKKWEGLGYYSRARNLHATSKYIANELNGIFPSDYESILALKGVGPYTAAAISSFAFDLAHAVVDGNVYRVLARVFGIKNAIDSTQGKKLFNALAQELLDKKKPADYNQAIMDFGATHCTPKSPTCVKCLMKTYCYAFQNQSIQQYPYKAKKIKRRQRIFNFLVINSGEEVYIEKRIGKDIWKNLYQFPMIESTALIQQFDQLKKEVKANENFAFAKFQLIKKSKPFKQQLTHQEIIACFWELQIGKDNVLKNSNYTLVLRQNLSKFAFPKIIDLYLSDKSLYLEL